MGGSAVQRHDMRLACAIGACIVTSQAPAAPPVPSFGTPIAPGDLRGEVAIAPSGAQLPPGHGTAAEGAIVYAGQCAACHGDKLQGVKAIGGPALAGGRNTLASAKPIKTVESFWPYATTLFDYVRRAMPFNAPGSLSDTQVYAVVAYILVHDEVITPGETIDAKSLPKVRMPNVDGFVPDPRPGAPGVLTRR